MENNKIRQPQRWNELSIKDKISYIIAIMMIASGMLMAFLSFFLNAFNISTGVLLYVAQAFLCGGSIIGVSAYLKSKWLEIDTRASDKIERFIEEWQEAQSNINDKPRRKN